MSNCNSNTVPLSTVSSSTSSSSCYNGCTPKNINVICKQIIIPYGQEILGVQGETGSSVRYFLVPKITEDSIDLSTATFYFITKMAGDDVLVTEVEEKEEVTNYIKLKWDITATTTQDSGNIQMQIVAKTDDYTWVTYPATFNIANGLYYDGLFSEPHNSTNPKFDIYTTISNLEKKSATSLELTLNKDTNTITALMKNSADEVLSSAQIELPEFLEIVSEKEVKIKNNE